MEHFLSLLPFERIAKKAGAARLSRDGIDELREVVEEIGMSVAERATRVALHAGRKTVRREDIEFVVGKIQIGASKTQPQSPKAENKIETPAGNEQNAPEKAVRV